ncbi:aldo/keto reductase [Neobacillus kokaensis]|uniref:Oxidoreductase n=1 Tax=Neobacillus kokaensis TaxID=2759023 RepID=A0ABQ3MZP6_9BACI|nr:aldo/keto reductase [Neobacillus kokaensis]GHH97779.1 oxidoreductase [Neobacillus kokaensis]
MKYLSVNGIVNNQQVPIKVSQLILGSGDLFRFDPAAVTALLDTFIEIGGNTIDTAHQYIKGEEIIGQWMAKRQNREKITILTKGAHNDDGEPGKRVNPKSITKDLMESLERLQTSYIDLYALHRDDEDVEVGPIVEILNEHIQAGRIKAIGTSNWTTKRLKAANDYAKEHNLVPFTFNSPNLSLAKCNKPRWPGCVSADEAMVQYHEEHKLPLLSWSSQAGGFFSGYFTPENRENEEMVEVYYSTENWERFDRAKQLAGKLGVTPIQIALAYVLNQSFPTAAIIGPEKVAELLSSYEGAGLALDQDLVNWLDLKSAAKPVLLQS